VLLDEVRRGTSTSDGLSIAQAVTEFLMEEDKKKPKTLFATHYHELTSLEDRYPRLFNMKVSIKEWNDDIIFLYKLIEGKSDKSYGINVARLAGLPERVIERARSILQSLKRDPSTLPDREVIERVQPTLFTKKDPVHKILKECDINRITPLEAIQLLSKLKKMTEKD
jgi:DNA mismatch repair protein MutS